jgi:hypothetical protein
MLMLPVCAENPREIKTIKKERKRFIKFSGKITISVPKRDA